MASGSRSMPTRERAGLASSTAAAWPPSPRVASTWTPAGAAANTSTTRSTITGSWTGVRSRGPVTDHAPSADRLPPGRQVLDGRGSRSGCWGSGRSRDLPSHQPGGSGSADVSGSRARWPGGHGTGTSEAPLPNGVLEGVVALVGHLAPRGGSPDLDAVDGAVHDDLRPRSGADAHLVEESGRKGDATLGVGPDAVGVGCELPEDDLGDLAPGLDPLAAVRRRTGGSPRR